MITVVDYDTSWPQQFQKIRSVLDDALRNIPIAIEHVGSTSVPGLAAKPVLDIDIVVEDKIQLNKVIPIVVLLGYQFAGDLGIKDRYAFKANSNQSPVDGAATVWPKHNLYCCIQGSISLSNHLLFRDALRSSPALAAEYGELKKRLADATDDIDVYVESKSAFIAGVLATQGIKAAHIEEVIAQNKKKQQ
jgi:GrpB-like predicted nucleotidyltransferase (UPF0157 family)